MQDSVAEFLEQAHQHLADHSEFFKRFCRFAVCDRFDFLAKAT
jgi:hypothetical protein